MTRTRDNYQVRGNTVGELIDSVNFLLQRIADRMDKIEGIRGTASIESTLDMNANIITDVGSGTVDDDAARLSDIATVNAFTVGAGDGLTGGGAISSNPTLNVGAGTGITVSADAVGITANGVTNSLLAQMSAATIKGRASGAGTGDPQDLTATQVKTILALIAADISDFNEAAEDAVLGASADSSSIDISYNDAGNSWTASVICANPTASVGLSAVNGSAATPMRSDGAPALSQSITPTWSGLHIFTANGNGAANSAIEIQATVPQFNWYDTDASTNEHRWAMFANGVNFVGRAVDDSGSSNNWVVVTRSAATITDIELLATNIKLNGKVGFQGTAAISKPTVSGSRGGNAALASVLTALANYGLITDSST